jgi:hypothetical protein
VKELFCKRFLNDPHSMSWLFIDDISADFISLLAFDDPCIGLTQTRACEQIWVERATHNTEVLGNMSYSTNWDESPSPSPRGVPIEVVEPMGGTGSTCRCPSSHI